MKSRYAFALVLLGFVWSHCSAQVKTKPQDTDPKMIAASFDDCKPASAPEDQGARLCIGVEDYSLLLKGDGPKPEIYLLGPGGERELVEVWNRNDPGFLGVGSSITWEVVHVPKKSVALIFQPQIEPRPDYSYFGGYDVIVRVSPRPVCIIGSVPFGSTSAAMTHGMATNPRERPCLRYDELEKRDWFRTTQRLAGEGQIKEAQLALQNVTDLAERFINYKEIADAQYKANDAAGARRTLMAGREEALKNKSVLELRFTLIHIVAGLASTGFYDEAKVDIKLFDEHKQLGMYLMVASYQGERKDFEAAKVTYREALQIELNRRERNDWNLNEICKREARMGLIEEAKHTLSLIRDPGARRSAESYILEYSPRR